MKAKKQYFSLTMQFSNHIFPPIAMLHSVNDSIDEQLKNWCISRSSFLQLLNFLEKEKIQTTTFFDLAGEKKNKVLSRQAILTFDDCPKHLFEFAIPELMKRRMKAVFYMPTANIGGYNSWDVKEGAGRMELMDEDDLMELSKYGMEIGSHSHHHIRLKAVSDPAQIAKEVSTSKRIIEAITQKQVVSFSYPYGSVPIDHRSILSGAGYQYGVSIYQPFETKFTLRRFGIYDKDTAETLALKFSRRYKWMRKVYDIVKKN